MECDRTKSENGQRSVYLSRRQSANRVMYSTVILRYSAVSSIAVSSIAIELKFSDTASYVYSSISIDLVID